MNNGKSELIERKREEGRVGIPFCPEEKEEGRNSNFLPSSPLSKREEKKVTLRREGLSEGAKKT